MPEIIPNLHPIFVHFTVALLSLSVGLFVVTLFVKSPLKEQWQTVARWTLWFGAGITIITGLTGLEAYNTVAHDTPSHLAMTDHRNWAVVTIVLFLVLASWSILWIRKGKHLGAAFVVCMVIAGGILGSTAWHGGELVYRYGLGVMSLPQSEGEGHSHSHGEGGGHGHGGDQAADHDDGMMDFGGMDEMIMEGESDGHDHAH
ncbi:MAG: DUF2231 domain-containing protein [Gammaproteobacteria bacterium]|nr:DUF2231 domain-containing protein [Gammaproteobacteria bacterium]